MYKERQANVYNKLLGRQEANRSSLRTPITYPCKKQWQQKSSMKYI